MTRPPNFDRLAYLYSLLEAVTFGPFLHHARCAFLPETLSSRNALILGDGNGRFTARLLSENPAVLIDAVDLSPAMLGRLVQNAGAHGGRVRIHQADARFWKPNDSSCDLIVTHFFLDCLTTNEVSELASRLRPFARPGARWILSDFAIPPGWFGWLIARPIVAVLYLAFRFLTGLRVSRLPNHQTALTKAGFIHAAERRWLHGLLIAELWTFEG